MDSLIIHWGDNEWCISYTRRRDDDLRMSAQTQEGLFCQWIELERSKVVCHVGTKQSDDSLEDILSTYRKSSALTPTLTQANTCPNCCQPWGYSYMCTVGLNV
jgi:hypothetical protein